MASIIMEAVDSQPIPMGKYPAIVESIEMDSNSQYGEQIRWTFRITDGEYANRKMLAWSAYRPQATERSKARRWYSVLTGITPSGKFDLANVVGKRCLILVKEQTRADGTVFSKVDDIQPLKPVNTRKPAPQQLAVDDVDGDEQQEDPFA